ncbi:MAG: hypothetical protein IH983_13970 [Planctomycetes bacterium]|nr:hypothetical protein [Planctomycetota bacterium]
MSPIVGGAALKGPADRLMRALGYGVSSLGVAEIYRDFLDSVVIDERDADNVAGIEQIGVKAIVADTIMSDDGKSESLAEKVLAVFD